MNARRHVRRHFSGFTPDELAGFEHANDGDTASGCMRAGSPPMLWRREAGDWIAFAVWSEAEASRCLQACDLLVYSIEGRIAELAGGRSGAR